MPLYTSLSRLAHTLTQGWLCDERATARHKRIQVAHGTEIARYTVLHRIRPLVPTTTALGAAGIAKASGVKSVLSTAFATTVALARHGTSVSAMWRREALTKIKRVLRVRTAAMISGVMNISLLMSFPRQLHTTGTLKNSPSTVAR